MDDQVGHFSGCQSCEFFSTNALCVGIDFTQNLKIVDFDERVAGFLTSPLFILCINIYNFDNKLCKILF